jgi:hypothetical protein
MPEDEWSEDSGGSAEQKPSKEKVLGLVTVCVILGSLLLAWAVGQGILPLGISAGMILGLGIIVGMVLMCCTSMMYMTSVTSKIPEYGDLETKFKEGMEYYDNNEWQDALDVFRRVMGPEMNHKRALYYAARCSEKLDDYRSVKLYCSMYIKMQPKDKEVWLMLATAHKKLFEFDQAEDAMKNAEKLR